MPIATLPRSFYLQPTQVVARELLGKVVVRTLESGERLAGTIVETEAYLRDDPASHSVAGPTARNRSMFGPGGHAYVYFSYGMHNMLNVVTGPAGVGEAVLIRALEPLEGTETMLRHRGIDDLRQATNGPGKAAQALAITRADDGADLTLPGGALRIEEGLPAAFEIVCTTRIGITKGIEHPWRYYIGGCRYVSRTRRTVSTPVQ